MDSQKELLMYKTPEQQSQSISKEKWHALQQEVRDYKLLEKTVMSRMFEDKSQQFYLLSIRFLEQWKLYAGFHLPESHYPDLTTTKAPDPYNEDLLEVNDPSRFIVKDDKFSDYHHMLKRQLVENVHFIVVNEPVMRLFKNYPGVAIARRYVFSPKGILVLQKKFPRVTFFAVSKTIRTLLINGRIPNIPVAVAQTSLYTEMAVWRKEISQYWLPRYFKYALKQEPVIDADLRNFRMWHYDQASDFPEVIGILRSNDMTTAIKNSKISRPRQLLNEQRTKFSELLISENSLVMIEYAEGGNFLLDLVRTTDDYRCHFCFEQRVVTVDCECREALYCSKLCLDRDAEGEHKYKCRRFQEKNFEFNFNHDSLSGRVGLDNLGNSCYMNASIQCLSNSLAFTNFIVNDNVGILINKDNPLGHKGKIANAYLNTLKNLWCGSKKSFRAEYLKKSIGETNQLFAGTNQHDAQEFLLVLLDALHEDMNRSRNREQKKNLPELKGDDQTLSSASWQHYLARNQSIIVDLFAGQYKSKLRCNHCKHESTTFETFFTLTLPVYTKEPVTFYFLGFNRPEFYSRVQMEVEDPTIEKLGKAFAVQLGKDYNPKRLKFFFLDNKIADVNNLSYDQISQVMRKESLYCLELTEEELKLYTPDADSINRINVYFARTPGQKSAVSRTPISRPFWFPFSKLTMREVQEHIWKWMFSAVITKKENEDISVNFAKNFVQADRAPLRFYLKIRDVDGGVTYYRNRQLLGQKDQLRMIQANFPNKCKFELECNVDYLINPVCDEKQFAYYREFRRVINVEPDAPTRLISCFDKLRKPEILDNSNQWACPNCKVHRDAEKIMSLYKTSKFLIIHLKRFKQRSDYRKVKVDSLVQFPMKLDLKDHLTNLKCPMDGFEAMRNINPKVDREKASYSLYAVINHVGALSGGHYTACALNNGAWFKYDDSYCREIKAEEVCTKDAYVLFYSRD